MLAVKELCYERNERVLFKQLIFQVCPGQVLHIVGPNGSGKTSLLQVLTGLIPPTSGSVLWYGVSIAQPACLFKQSLLYISHQLGMKAALTPFENLYLFLIKRALNTAQQPLKKIRQRAIERIKWVLQKLDLGHCADIFTRQLSIGQQRRLALARLLLVHADCWILDEPFAGLDKQGIILVSSFIEEQRSRGGMVILTNHQSDCLGGEEKKEVSLEIYEGT